MKSDSETRLTAAGQITIHKPIREWLGIDVGDYVIIQKCEDDGRYLKAYPAKLEIVN